MPQQNEAASDEAAREPKVRRISNKPARKASGGKPSLKDDPAEIAQDTDDAPKPDAKRGNRRRRGKGKSGQNEADPSPSNQPSAEDTITLATETSEPLPDQTDKPETREKPRESPQQPQKPRRKPDPEKVAKNAWKIFLAEVSEEGVALIGDNDARELARRCFRLSEIFLEEEVRRG